MKLLILNSTRKPVPKTYLQLVSKKVESFLSRKGHAKEIKSKELVLLFLSSARMKQLNGQFRSKPYPTDVLSFTSGDPTCLGELAFCPSVLEKQARDQGHSYRKELAYMFIHGCLHLLGYDHEKSESEAQQMFQLQDKIFKNLPR